MAAADKALRFNTQVKYGSQQSIGLYTNIAFPDSLAFMCTHAPYSMSLFVDKCL